MQKIVVANWKMYKTISEAERFIEELLPLVESLSGKVMLAVPFTALAIAAKLVEGTNITVGAQNIDFHTEGPYTGEISALMVKDAGAKFVILGHSERRRFFHESSEVVNLKVKAALEHRLQPLVCMGETSEQRQANEVESTLESQFHLSLECVDTGHIASIMIAYEPIWAIGTGLTASLEDTLHVHGFFRKLIAERWGVSALKKVPILYGGSVRADNARELLEIQDVNGVLVGGASLSVDSFSKIIFSQHALNLS
ncbi:MAG: triose-phosphate isomerase [Parachlamydiaceae bacterium]|nr:triose-phosphate isomerase [Parachlamydiaceae bacterium]